MQHSCLKASTRHLTLMPRNTDIAKQAHVTQHSSNFTSIATFPETQPSAQPPTPTTLRSINTLTPPHHPLYTIPPECD
ncbi:hypothetical protein E2C01_062155 [Portunus trituberculatus]|uniref:Uncharacterized protein n=1 Tax=Portunus trituberculatus TaxID=210409 RepID=A0A5B7HDA2_PORTR|nr:hypothetical protein [Portunus trituberculatus]